MKIVVTEYKQGDNSKCQFCDTIIAKLADTMIPSAEECYKMGMFQSPILADFVHKTVQVNTKKIEH